MYLVNSLSVPNLIVRPGESEGPGKCSRISSPSLRVLALPGLPFSHQIVMVDTFV